MLALIFNFLLSRLKRSCRDIRTRALRIHIRRIAEDLKLQQEFEQIALTSIAQSLKTGISERSHKRLTNCLTRFARISNEFGMAPPELLLVYTELAKVTPTPKPRPAPRKKPAPRTSPTRPLPPAVKFTPSLFSTKLFTGENVNTLTIYEQMICKGAPATSPGEHTPEQPPEHRVNNPSGVHPTAYPVSTCGLSAAAERFDVSQPSHMAHVAPATPPDIIRPAAETPCNGRLESMMKFVKVNPISRPVAAKIGRSLAPLVLALALTSCGYSTDRNAQFKTVNANKDPIQTVCLDIMGSREFRRDLELQLTEALAKRIEAESPFKLAKKQFADTILTGEVLEVRQGTLGRDFKEVRPRETAATLIVRFQWKDLRTGEVLVDHPRFVQTVDYIRPVGEDFYHAMQRACDRMAERIVEELESDNW